MNWTSGTSWTANHTGTRASKTITIRLAASSPASGPARSTIGAQRSCTTLAAATSSSAFTVLMIAENAATTSSDPAIGVSTCAAITELARSPLGRSGNNARIDIPIIITDAPMMAWKMNATPTA